MGEYTRKFSLTNSVFNKDYSNIIAFFFSSHAYVVFWLMSWEETVLCVKLF